MKHIRNQKILTFLMILPLLLILQLGVGFFIFSNLQNITRTEERETKIDTYLRTNTKYTSNAESAQQGYLLTGDKKYLETFETDSEEINKNEDYFKTLPADFSSAEIKSIQRTSKSKFKRMALTIELFKAGSKDSSLNMVKEGSGKLMMDSIRTSTTALRNNISTQLKEKKDTERSLFILFLAIIAVLIVFSLFIIWYSYRKLKAYTENLELLNASLGDANERMKKYTFMSYHELKTPLRSISSFAQLLKKKFGHSLVGEEKEYIEYITENVKQMDITINEMRKKYLTDPICNEED